MTSPADRIIHCEDAIEWLKRSETLTGCSVITSMPDFTEFPHLTLDQWKSWFTDAAELILSRIPDDGIAIFYQTDIKKNGAWIDKGYLCQKAAEKTGHDLLWHKIVCRSPLGNVTFGRPGYSHLLCFSKGVKLDLAHSTVDVLPEAGETSWTRGTGIKASQAACKFILKHTATRTIINPFCGHGTILAVANDLGLSAVGIELSRRRAQTAKTFTTQSLTSTS